MTVVRLIDMPTRVKGHTLENDDGTYTIFINARLSIEQQREAYLHELKHLMQKDFEKEYVQRIEAYAHGLKEAQI